MPSGITRREYREQVLADIDASGVVEVVLLQKVKYEIRKSMTALVKYRNKI